MAAGQIWGQTPCFTPPPPRRAAVGSHLVCSTMGAPCKGRTSSVTPHGCSPSCSTPCHPLPMGTSTQSRGRPPPPPHRPTGQSPRSCSPRRAEETGSKTPLLSTAQARGHFSCSQFLSLLRTASFIQYLLWLHLPQKGTLINRLKGIFFFFLNLCSCCLRSLRAAVPLPPPQPSLPPARSPPRGARGTSPSPGILLLSPLHLCPKVQAAGSAYFSHEKFPWLQALLPTRFPIFQARALQHPGQGPASTRLLGARRGREKGGCAGHPLGTPGTGRGRPPPGLRSAAASSLHRFALAGCWEQRPHSRLAQLPRGRAAAAWQVPRAPLPALTRAARYGSAPGRGLGDRSRGRDCPQGGG